MKRLFSFLLTLLTLLALAAPASADVLWSPIENPFFDAHYPSCEYEGRSYYANGSKGFITLWDAPGGSAVRAQYQNGETLWVGYTYHGEWALISCREGRDALSGWAPLEDLYLVYDHISFEEEYGDQFRDYNGEFADYAGEAGEEFWFWEYPYAGNPKHRLKIDQRGLDILTGKSDEIPNCISKIYVDPNNQTNRIWGYVEWLYGSRNFWILLDNPTCNGIMTSCIPEVDDLIYSGQIVEPREPVLPGPSYTPYILVAVVVIATAGLLRIFWKKKK